MGQVHEPCCNFLIWFFNKYKQDVNMWELSTWAKWEEIYNTGKCILSPWFKKKNSFKFSLLQLYLVILFLWSNSLRIIVDNLMKSKIIIIKYGIHFS